MSSTDQPISDSTDITAEEQTADKLGQRNRQLARSTLIVMIAFGVSKALSLVQTVIIAAVFGIGPEWDAFVTANRIPELIFTLIAGGALSHAFIPIFSSYLARDDKDGAWKIASNVINTLFTTTFIVSAVVFFISDWLIGSVVAPGFSPQERAQTVELMQILLVSTLIFSVSGIVMGILQSHNHFLLPALAPIMFDFGILFGIIVLMGPFGVHGIAMGAVLGAALHLGIQIPGLIRYKATWKSELGLRNPVLWRVIRLMLPRVGGLGVFSLNFIVMNNIASRLGTGSVSALDWGWRLMQIPQTLVGTAMGIVIFPTLAALSELGDERGKRDAMTGALRFILIASIPSSVGLIMIGRPLISLLERGAFDASASALVYSTLQFFALGLIVHAALEIIARSFYADKDTLTPLYAALGGAAINLAGSYWFSRVAYVETLTLSNMFIRQLAPLGFTPEVGNVGGLALANSLGVMFEVVVLLIILRKRWHGINENTLASTIIKTTIASLTMAGAIAIINFGWIAAGLDSDALLFTIALVTIQVGVGGLVFLVTAYLLRMKELGMLFNLIIRRKPLKEVTT